MYLEQQLFSKTLISYPQYPTKISLFIPKHLMLNVSQPSLNIWQSLSDFSSKWMTSPCIPITKKKPALPLPPLATSQAQALLISYLDYWRSLLFGRPLSHIALFQATLYTAATFIFMDRCTAHGSTSPSVFPRIQSV